MTQETGNACAHTLQSLSSELEAGNYGTTANCAVPGSGLQSSRRCSGGSSDRLSDRMHHPVEDSHVFAALASNKGLQGKTRPLFHLLFPVACRSPQSRNQIIRRLSISSMTSNFPQLIFSPDSHTKHRFHGNQTSLTKGRFHPFLCFLRSLSPCLVADDGSSEQRIGSREKTRPHVVMRGRRVKKLIELQSTCDRFEVALVTDPVFDDTKHVRPKGRHSMSLLFLFPVL